jgi:hypothetical protein
MGLCTVAKETNCNTEWCSGTIGTAIEQAHRGSQLYKQPGSRPGDEPMHCSYNPVQHSPSAEYDSRSAGQETPRLVWNQKVHWCVHKRPQQVPTLSNTNQVYIVLRQRSPNIFDHAPPILAYIYLNYICVYIVHIETHSY